MRFFKRSDWDGKDFAAAAVTAITLFYLASPLTPFMQVQHVVVAFPEVSLTRTVTLPMRMHYTDEVETIDGRLIDECYRAGTGFYEWRGDQPVIFELACHALPPGSYIYTACWTPAILDWIMRPSCYEPVPFEVPPVDPVS
ncbi:hypothetical protein AADZ90_021425 [Aestuariibius sp. 2305UL40-4]